MLQWKRISLTHSYLEISKIYRSYYCKNVRPKFSSLKFLTQKRSPPIPQILNTDLSSQERQITAMDKGKNVQTKLTKEELQRKIEWVTREIQKVEEEGLKVDMTTAIYKAAAVTLDEDPAS